MVPSPPINNNLLQRIFCSPNLSRISGVLLLQLTLILLISLPSILSAESMPPGPRDRCPVCGMFVAPFPNWMAQIEFNDGTREFFDGPKDMFRYYLNLPKDTSAHSKKNVTSIYVTEYYSTKLLHVDDVFFVTHSDIMGPMGKELVPVQSKEAADAFKQEHKAKDIFTFEQITNEILSGY